MTISVPGPNDGSSPPAAFVRITDLRAEAAEEQHRLDDEARRVALVQVEAALEHGDGAAGEPAEQEPPDVARAPWPPASRAASANGTATGSSSSSARPPSPEPSTIPTSGTRSRTGADRGLERVEARGLVGGGMGVRRVDHRVEPGAVTAIAGLQSFVQGSTAGGPQASAGPTRVPTPGCRSRPAGPPGDGAGTPSRPGTEAPEATGPGSRSLM